MKKLLLLITLMFTALTFSQNTNVGINTTNPKATLEVKAKTNGATQAEGLMIPSLTGAEVLAMPVTAAHNGLMVFNITESCIQVYQSTGWSCLGTRGGTLSNYLNATYVGSTGTWVQNIPASGNTVKFRVSNNSSMGFTQLDFNNAVSLAGSSQGLFATPAANYSNMTIAPGNSVILTYNVTGTPTSAGTLTANFNAAGGISAYGNIQIEPQSGVQALQIQFAGNYVSNTQLSSHSLSLKVKNFSASAMTNANLSNVISLTGISGITVNPNQNTSVSLASGAETTLTYTISGIATAPGTLTATFIPNQYVSGNATATQIVALFQNAVASNLVINGSYAYGQSMNTQNTIQITLTNNNTFDLLQINLSNAITLSGAVNNINIAPNQNTSVSIPAGQSVTITYNLNGTSMVQAGGILTASFQQNPFGTLTAQKNVLGNNNFYATPNAVTLPSNGGTYTFTITSGLAWNSAVDAANTGWLQITSGASGSGNGTITISTTPKTSSQGNQIGYITVTRPSDGASITIAVNQSPTDNFQITGFSSQAPNFTYGSSNASSSLITQYYLSIHSSKSSTIQTNQTNLQLYGPLPDFVQSITFNGSNIVVTPKERTISGIPTSGTLRFTYGTGYLSNPIVVYQNQKAAKCPLNPPVRADNGYKIWNSTNNFDGSIWNTFIETRPGIDNFSDYTYSNLFANQFYAYFSVIGKSIVQNNNQSSLFFSINDEESGLFMSFNSKDTIGFSNPSFYKYVYIYRTNKHFIGFINNSTSNFVNPDLTNSVVVSPVICADGWDEDTPIVSGNAGWRQ